MARTENEIRRHMAMALCSGDKELGGAWVRLFGAPRRARAESSLLPQSQPQLSVARSTRKAEGAWFSTAFTLDGSAPGMWRTPRKHKLWLLGQFWRRAPRADQRADVRRSVINYKTSCGRRAGRARRNANDVHPRAARNAKIALMGHRAVYSLLSTRKRTRQLLVKPCSRPLFAGRILQLLAIVTPILA